jgi:hypothetical protein
VTAQFVWWIRTGGARQRWCYHGQHMRARAAPQRRLHLHYPPGAHGLRGTGPWRRATTTQRRQPAQITCRTTPIRPAHHAEAEESGGQPVAQLLREPAGHGLGGHERGERSEFFFSSIIYGRCVPVIAYHSGTGPPGNLDPGHVPDGNHARVRRRRSRRLRGDGPGRDAQLPHLRRVRPGDCVADARHHRGHRNP